MTLNTQNRGPWSPHLVVGRSALDVGDPVHAAANAPRALVAPVRRVPEFGHLVHLL